MPEPFVILSGTANQHLAHSIARSLGVPTGACEIKRFPDGEVSIELGEPVRGHEVFIVQPTAPPVDRHLVELLALADACRRAAATRVTAIIPYFGYARADKRLTRREPVTARMVADLLQTVGIEHIVTVDRRHDRREHRGAAARRRPAGSLDRRDPWVASRWRAPEARQPRRA